MSHIVNSCPLTKLNGGLSRLQSADDEAGPVAGNTMAGDPLSPAAYETRRIVNAGSSLS